MSYVAGIVKMVSLFAVTSLAIFSAGCATPRNVKTWTQVMSDFSANHEKQQGGTARQSEWRPYTLQTPAKPQTSQPEVQGKIDPNEEFRKQLTGGVEVIWDEPGKRGRIKNRNIYPVKIKKIYIGSAGLYEVDWSRTKGDGFDPGDSEMFWGPNIRFEIYSITGHHKETKTRPKRVWSWPPSLRWSDDN